MSRTYSDPSYGAHKSIPITGLRTSIDGTYQTAETLGRYTFMTPAKVVDWNVQIIAGGTDLGADVFFYLGKSVAGTGTVAVLGTADPLQGTGTHANYSVLDASATETAFAAGDDLVFQAIGTIGHAMVVNPVAEVLETYVQSDS